MRLRRFKCCYGARLEAGGEGTVKLFQGIFSRQIKEETQTANPRFAARPSGTENIYKLYAESFTSPGHLDALIAEAQEIVSRSLGGGQGRAA